MILRPEWLAEVIKPLFRPQFDDPDVEDVLRQLGIPKQRFDMQKRSILRYGRCLTHKSNLFFWVNWTDINTYGEKVQC